MRKLILGCLLFSSFSASVVAEPSQQDFYKLYFKQGVAGAGTCHVFYRLSEMVFAGKSKISREEAAQLLKDVKYKKLIDDIYNYTGNQSAFLDGNYNNCINSLELGVIPKP